MTDSLFDQPSGGGYGSTYSKPRCHTTHKPIKLGNGEIVGASCGSPRDGYDIYIGFDYGMKMQHQPFPWDLSKYADPIVEFQYHITDMCAPKSPKEFRKMIEWCADQLDDGKKIHVGCIGGHGRTGTFLAALVSLYEDLTDDPIKWVRENHCKKAVESKSQIKFLVKHFGCKKAKPTKQHWDVGGSKFEHWRGTTTGRLSGKQSHHGNVSDLFPPARDSHSRKRLEEKIKYVGKKGSIWG